MNKYVDIDIELSDITWDLLKTMANDQGITIDKLMNDILKQELDKMDAHEYINSGKTV